MNRPNQFIVNTQFPTQKNEITIGGFINVTGGLVIPAGSIASGTLTINAGSIGALTRGRIRATYNNNPYVSQGISYSRVGTSSGVSAPYSVVAFIYRSAPTVTNFQVLIQNPYAASLTLEATTHTVYFHANLFKAPYL